MSIQCYDGDGVQPPVFIVVDCDGWSTTGHANSYRVMTITGHARSTIWWKRVHTKLSKCLQKHTEVTLRSGGHQIELKGFVMEAKYIERIATTGPFKGESTKSILLTMWLS